MYIRFLSPHSTSVSGVNKGIFTQTYKVENDPMVPTWLKQAILEETKWFNQNLPIPPRGQFQVRSRKLWHSVGICWFHQNAKIVLGHCFALKALLIEAGYQVSVRKTANPGQILYSDDWQIIAKPAEKTPTSWH